MKILSSTEIRQADSYTIINEPVSSVDLMERAATACYEWITQRFDKSFSFKIFCGTGNNGGDGLVIARLLAETGYRSEVFVVRYNNNESSDFKINLKCLREINTVKIKDIKSEGDIPAIQKNEIVIDSIFGTGLNKATDGLVASCIRHINAMKANVLSVDVPSGLFTDIPVDHESAIVHARFTLSFQVPKLAFMFSENHQYVGDWEILNVGLNQNFIDSFTPGKNVIDRTIVKSILQPREKFSHKGIFGRALLIAGSYGKMGAAVLAAKGCLRSGAGLLTVYIPGCGYEIIQTSVPEAMVQTDSDQHIYSSGIDTRSFSAVGIGCGIGTATKTMEALKQLLSSCKVPLVLDADAINILGLDENLLDMLPENSVLTPHPKEFERIVGKAQNDFHRYEIQVNFSMKRKVVVILKGAHTCITCPDGTVYFNNTGNPGMAKGGTGDVLTGIVLSFLAQHYSHIDASILGVYLHGLAGDFAVKKQSMHSMIATDLIENIGDAFKTVNQY